MQLVLVIIYIAVAWHFLNFFQHKIGIFYFGKVSDYFVYKLIISLFLGCYYYSDRIDSINC
jgi:hypothetical protein